MSEGTRVFLLRFAGPLQSWGGASRFTRRGTNPEPTKSGVIGLLAAAQGRRRCDSVEDLVHLRIGIRVDRPGVLVNDFQTAIRREANRGGDIKETSMPLSNRHYLADAVFLAGVEGPTSLIEGLAEVVRRPRFPLALGRRSCPPAGQLVLGVAPGPLESALMSHPWLGRPVTRIPSWTPPARLLVVRDLASGEPTEAAEREHDVPLSFDPEHRKFGWRWVRREWVGNPAATSDAPFVHDPFVEVG